MSRIKGKNTKPDLKLRSMLHKAGFRFRVHYENLPRKPDIVFLKYKTVIFVNGCFWHRHLGCKYAYEPKSRIDFWRSKFSDTVERDKRKNEELRMLGWNVIIVWECELNEYNEDLLQQLISEIRN